MSDMVQQLEAVREGGSYAALLARFPYAQRMGFEIEVKDGRLRLHLPFRDEWVGNPWVRSLHGGVVGAMLETVAQLQIMHATEVEALPRLVDITIDYLRLARAESLTAEAELLRKGRRVANLRMTAYQGQPDKVVASGRAHFLF